MRDPLEDITYKPAQFYDFADIAPVQEKYGKVWWMRGQNYALAYIQADAGFTLVRENQPDEYMVYLPDTVSATITSGDETADAPAESLSIVPPGRSEIVVRTAGEMICIFSSKAEDIAAACFNAEAYAEPDVLVTPLEEWPEPIGGFKLRVYDLADYPPMGYPSKQPWTPESGEERFGRYFRNTSVMVHLHQRVAARNQGKTLPHAQDDYEQAALALAGTRAHHVRTPWGPDMSKWKDDVHVVLESPSFLVFPPGLIHTTTTLSAGSKWVDVFSPPRHDIGARPGWVRNEDEYPMPASGKN